MPLFEALDVVYDGRCVFCQRAVNTARVWDMVGVYRFHNAWDRAAVEAKFPMLRCVDLDEAMHVVTASGRIYRGFFAFRRMMWSSPLVWPFLPVFYMPGSAFLGRRIYAWVARNRNRFGCRSEGCVVPPRSSERDPV